MRLKALLIAAVVLPGAVWAQGEASLPERAAMAVSGSQTLLAQAYRESRPVEPVLALAPLRSGLSVAAGKRREAPRNESESKSESKSEAEVVDPQTYKPKTPHDNTPWRFNMHQNGKRMTADEFDAWMKARGVRVAKGAPAQPEARIAENEARSEK